MKMIDQDGSRGKETSDESVESDDGCSYECYVTSSEQVCMTKRKERGKLIKVIYSSELWVLELEEPGL